MSRRLIIFDMDGTMCDSWPGMEYCYNQTFKAYGRENMTEDEFLEGFVGNLTDNLRKMLGLEGKELEEAVATFRTYYREKGHALSKPFDGIIELIKGLRSEGYALGVATMIYQPYAVDILKELGIDDCFDAVEGSDKTGEMPKSDMILRCMETTGIGKEETVMIGDSFRDQKAAEKAGVGFIAAAYGYGITVANCEEYGYEYASRPEGLRRAIEAHWE